MDGRFFLDLAYVFFVVTLAGSKSTTFGFSSCILYILIESDVTDKTVGRTGTTVCGGMYK